MAFNGTISSSNFKNADVYGIQSTYFDETAVFLHALTLFILIYRVGKFIVFPFVHTTLRTPQPTG